MIKLMELFGGHKVVWSEYLPIKKQYNIHACNQHQKILDTLATLETYTTAAPPVSPSSYYIAAPLVYPTAT